MPIAAHGRGLSYALISRLLNKAKQDGYTDAIMTGTHGALNITLQRIGMEKAGQRPDPVYKDSPIPELHRLQVDYSTSNIDHCIGLANVKLSEKNCQLFLQQNHNVNNILHNSGCCSCIIL